MTNKFYPLAFAAMLGIGAFAVSGGGASAMAIPAVRQTAPDATVNGGNILLQDVSMRSWNQNRDGDRFRYRRGNYRHYHNGYYYSSPWWALSFPLAVIITDRDRGWCSRHGYSRHHTWMRNGQRHRCR